MPKGRDGAIVVDDGDEDELDLDDTDDDDDDDDVDEEEDEEPAPTVEQQRQRRRADKPKTEDKPDKPSYEALLASNARLEEAVRRNNTENAKNRTRLKALETGGTDTNVVDQAAIDRQVELEVEKRLAAAQDEHTATAERSTKLETSLRKKALEAALKGAGFNGTFPTALKVVDLDSITIADGDDGDYAIDGVEAVVEGLKKEIPAWFRPVGRPTPPPRRGAEEVDGGGRPGRPAPRQTWEQRVNDSLTGRR